MKLNSIRKVLNGKVRNFSPTKISSFTADHLHVTLSSYDSFRWILTRVAFQLQLVNKHKLQRKKPMQWKRSVRLASSPDCQQIYYSKTCLERPPRTATTCFQRPLFRARTVSYWNCIANSDHLPCATSDRVFRAPSACFPCGARPCDDPKPSFLWGSATKVWRQAKKCSGRKVHLSSFTFWTLLMIFVISFLSFKSPLSW